jgi:hypothetical protein
MIGPAAWMRPTTASIGKSLLTECRKDKNRPVYKNEVRPDIHGWWRRGYASNRAEKSLQGKTKESRPGARSERKDPSTRTWSRPELLEVSKDVEAVWASLKKKGLKEKTESDLHDDSLACMHVRKRKQNITINN